MKILKSRKYGLLWNTLYTHINIFCPVMFGAFSNCGQPEPGPAIASYFGQNALSKTFIPSAHHPHFILSQNRCSSSPYLFHCDLLITETLQKPWNLCSVIWRFLPNLHLLENWTNLKAAETNSKTTLKYLGSISKRTEDLFFPRGMLVVVVWGSDGDRLCFGDILIFWYSGERIISRHWSPHGRVSFPRLLNHQLCSITSLVKTRQLGGRRRYWRGGETGGGLVVWPDPVSICQDSLNNGAFSIGSSV